MSPQPLVIVGAGGFARETVELVAAINAREPRWDLRGLPRRRPDDARPPRLRTAGAGRPTDAIADDDSVTICVGNPRNYTSRARIVGRLGLADERYATLIHPTAVIPASVDVGHGTVIHALNVATGLVHHRRPRGDDAGQRHHARRRDRRLLHGGRRRAARRRRRRRDRRVPRLGLPRARGR